MALSEEEAEKGSDLSQSEDMTKKNLKEKKKK